MITKIRTNIFLTRTELKKLRGLSKKTGAPVAELVRRAVDEYLERFGRKMKKLIVLLILPLLVSFVMAEEKVGFDFQKEWLDMSVEQRREYVPKLRKDIPISEKCLRDAKSFGEYWECAEEVAIEEAVVKEDKVKAEGVTAGMGGLRWGSAIEEFSAMKKPSPDPLMTGLNRKGIPVTFGRRPYSIGELELWASYSFYKNKFYYFSIKADSKQGETIRQALTSKYGQPKGISPLVLYVNPNAKVGTGYSWEVRDVTITLNINEMKNESHLSYIYIPILKLRISDDKKTSEGMKKDL